MGVVAVVAVFAVACVVAVFAVVCVVPADVLDNSVVFWEVAAMISGASSACLTHSPATHHWGIQWRRYTNDTTI